MAEWWDVIIIMSIRINDFPIITEIKEKYIFLRENGHNRCDATELLKASYETEITKGAADDGVLFWIGLADAQWSKKELTIAVAKKGQTALDTLEVKLEIAPSDIICRRNNYCQAPMPERKITKRKNFKCAWNIGDTFSVELIGKDAEAQGLSGKYALLQKVDNLSLDNGCVVPLVRISLWDATEIPPTKEKFYSRRPLRLKDAYTETGSTGFQYRLQILFSSKKQVNECGFNFIGNYPDICSIDDELILNRPGEIVMDYPKDVNFRCVIYYQRDRIYEQKRHKTVDGSVSSTD